jgi:hypothetical protein
VPRLQEASHGDYQQLADAMPRVSHPNTAFRSGTIAPAPPHCRVALIHTSPAAATDGTGVALNGGVGETPWGQTSTRPVTKIVGMGWC